MSTTLVEHGVDGASPLDQVTREHILARLREAARLAENDLVAHLDPLCDLLLEVIDQAGSLSLVRQLDSNLEMLQRSTLLQGAAFRAATGEPLNEFLLIPFGEVKVERPQSGSSFVFTHEHAEAASKWFDGIGRKLAIDYEHQSYDRFNTRPDGLRPAAGWIGGLQIRDDGLWAVDVMWTDRARELLSSGEYRYFSPVIFWSDDNHSNLAALGPVALTNDPAMQGVSSLAATRNLVQTDAEDSPDVKLEAAQAEINLLKRQLAAQEADIFVERGMRLGKVLDSNSLDWREDYLRDPVLAEEKLSRAPVLLPPGRMLTLDQRGEVQALPEVQREYRRNGDIYRRWGIGPEDLAAYDQAVAAGRVVLSSNQY